ncbi:MAG: DUF2066 domain-containing protein [Anderseniella sp.]
MCQSLPFNASVGDYWFAGSPYCENEWGSCKGNRCIFISFGKFDVVTRLRTVSARLLILLVCVLFGGPLAAKENPLYTISGIEVDVRAETASEAKRQAITQANVKALALFVKRVGGDQVLDKLSDIPTKRIDAMLDSLSIEEERTGPQRYIGKLTIRFLPDRMRKMMADLGVSYSEKVAGRTVIIPVWRTPEGAVVVWEDNPWRTAWLALKAENSLVPLIIPVGDFADISTLNADQAAARDEARLEAIRLRYEADNILIAEATPVGEDSVQAVMAGDSPVGKVGFDKTYAAENAGGIPEAAAIAATRFNEVMLLRWKKKTEERPITRALPIASLPVAVAFYSNDEWAALRSRILATPGVAGVDISTISQGGAIVQLSYVSGFEQLRNSLWSAGLALQNVGGTWVLQSN